MYSLYRLPATEELTDNKLTEFITKHSAECSFDDEEHILQFGNPEELSEEQIEVVEQETNTYQVPTTKVMVNHSFKKSSAWNTLKTKYKNNSGVLYGTVTQNGTMGEKHSQNSTSEGTYYLTASSYGSGSGWHGAVTTYSLSESATDFQMQYAQKMCVDSTSAGKRQKGRFQMILSDASGKIVAGVDIYKSGDGTKGKYRMIVDGKIRKEAEIDLSLHNKRFGENRAENKKKKITAIKTAKSSCITKKGSRISFDLGGIKASFTVESVAAKSVSKITAGFFQKRTAAAMKYNGMYEMKLVKNYKKTVTETIDKIVLEWHDVQNKFNATPDIIKCIHSSTGNAIGVGVGNGGVNRGLHDEVAGKWQLYSDETDLYLGPPARDTFKPYYTKGDKIPCEISTGGYVTGGGNQVIFSVPLSKPLVGVSAATASTNNGFRGRQGGKYTHGSSASAYVKPASYSCYVRESWIEVRMTIDKTTNVTNNDAIGIAWSGYLTFS